MTYREKLQKEYPEMVNINCTGRCMGCPSGVGYGPESVLTDGCIISEKKCAECWDKVIPGTEKNLTFKIPTNLDEMIEYFKAHGFEASRQYYDHSDTYAFQISKGKTAMIDVSFEYPTGKSETERGAVMLDYCERMIVKFYDDVLETKQTAIDTIDKRNDELQERDLGLKLRTFQTILEPRTHILPTRKEAEEVICKLEEIIDRYTFCTVGDLKFILDMNSTMDDERRGWYSVKDAKIRKVTGGYIVVLPVETVIG